MRDQIISVQVVNMATQQLIRLQQINQQAAFMAVVLYRRIRQRRHRRYWIRPWIARRPQFGDFENLMAELERESQGDFVAYLSIRTSVGIFFRSLPLRLLRVFAGLLQVLVIRSWCPKFGSPALLWSRLFILSASPNHVASLKATVKMILGR